MFTDSGTVSSKKYIFCSPWSVRAGSGVNNVILGLGAAMSGDYNPQILVTGWNPPEIPGQQWVRCRSVEFPLHNLLGFTIHFVPTLIRLFRVTRGASVVNAHFASSAIVPLIVLRKLRLIPKLVLSVHGSDVTYAAQAPRLERALYAWMYHSADAVVACSAALAKEVREISPAARVIAIWNGLAKPPERFGPRPLEEPYLISVAAFTKNKGHSVILRAFQRVLETHPNMKLVLIGGDGPNQAAVEQRIADLGLADRVRVFVNLEHRQVWNWIRHAECFVHAARKEAFGLAILEAALVRTPVVTTIVGGAKEYVLPGVDALTCEPRDHDEMASAILKTLADPEATERRVSAFYRKAAEFTWEKAWDKYRAVIKVR